MSLKATECSEEMGYDHSKLRCWFDNRIIFHNGPLYWVCPECRELPPTTRLTWREMFQVWIDSAIDRVREWRSE